MTIRQTNKISIDFDPIPSDDNNNTTIDKERR